MQTELSNEIMDTENDEVSSRQQKSLQDLQYENTKETIRLKDVDGQNMFHVPNSPEISNHEIDKTRNTSSNCISSTQSNFIKNTSITSASGILNSVSTSPSILLAAPNSLFSIPPNGCVFGNSTTLSTNASVINETTQTQSNCAYLSCSPPSQSELEQARGRSPPCSIHRVIDNLLLRSNSLLFSPDNSSPNPVGNGSNVTTSRDDCTTPLLFSNYRNMHVDEISDLGYSGAIHPQPINSSGFQGRGNRRRRTTRTTTGRNKLHSCKHCTFACETKEGFWEHARTHIRPGKIMVCPSCPFATEYKHHLEYHLRNHIGSKPFKCVKCHYSCVNLSMLRSHMKSHLRPTQFRCNNCPFVSRTITGLQSHIERNQHSPAPEAIRLFLWLLDT